jgi:pimeloyl-ACP methyl ester carboxylesterase
VDVVDSRSLRVRANGLEHHVLVWEPRGWAATALLLHGFMDAAATWDRVAPSLASAGLRVVAPDLRGFGEGGRVGEGGYYHFADYVFDVADLVDGLCGETPLHVVGHSMGGSVATLYAGAFPERPKTLALLEGLGPPDNPFEVAPLRMRKWIDDVRATRARPPRSMTEKDALRRLAANHARVDEALLRDRMKYLVSPAGEGLVAWKNDPLHRTTSPVPFYAAAFAQFMKRIACPVLFVSGGPTGWHPPDEDDRLACAAKLERAEIADAGHMMHWTRPKELAEILLRFVGGG